MKLITQPSQEELAAFFSGPLFSALKDLSPEQSNVARWWLDQPTKAELAEMEGLEKAEEVVQAIRHQSKQGKVPNSATSVKVLEYIKTHPGCARAAVLKEVGVTEVQYAMARKSLLERGLIRVEGETRNAVLYAN